MRLAGLLLRGRPNSEEKGITLSNAKRKMSYSKRKGYSKNSVNKRRLTGESERGKHRGLSILRRGYLVGAGKHSHRKGGADSLLFLKKSVPENREKKRLTHSWKRVGGKKAVGSVVGAEERTSPISRLRKDTFLYRRKESSDRGKKKNCQRGVCPSAVDEMRGWRRLENFFP